MPNEGEEAPDFEALDQDGNRVRLSDHRGKWVVLYFFPKAFTPGCTRETQEFSTLWNEFAKLGVEVFGISVDSVNTQRRFAERYGVKFKLLSDKDKSISRAYGVLRSTGTAERVTFIINPDGKVAKVIKDVKPEEHPRKALEYLSKALGGQ
ncbi:peroxiredoxin [Vulcanisaeta thermophila]|uniref:peroxiredoxin n=1 Tax=Vulcanisaeta thermophila TaxID=867917 RepID=UPI000852DB93|nr:peroxiredoxin [Vulcanisaeta thermophila]